MNNPRPCYELGAVFNTDPYKPICWAAYPGFLIPPLMGEELSAEVWKKGIPKIGQPPNTKKCHH